MVGSFSDLIAGFATCRLSEIDHSGRTALATAVGERVIPLQEMDREKLFSSLIRQYLIFSIYRAFVESLASENAGRLQAMQMAERNIDEHLSDLNLRFHRQRQGAISAELLDIVTGSEALAVRERKG